MEIVQLAARVAKRPIEILKRITPNPFSRHLPFLRKAD
jgi:hypothetical protein